jgi:hypothetical protein
MNPITDFQLQTHLSRYLNKVDSLAAFKSWFDEETWGLAAETDSPVRQLAGEIEFHLAEFTNGGLSEDELREVFRPLVPIDLANQVIDTDYQMPITRDEPVLVTF